MLEAVIFDLDGTLVDIFDVHLEAFQRVIRSHYGLDFTKDDLLKGYGQKTEGIARMFFEKHNVTADYEKLARERAKIAEQNVGKAKTLPGVSWLLKELKNREIKIALATSCRKKLTKLILETIELRDYFDVVITAEDVEGGKPDPEIFLRAAEKLAVQPGSCVVFEDSLYGVKAAKSAGMKVVAVTTGGRSMDELVREKPDIVVDSLEKLKVDTLFNSYNR